MDRRSVVNYSHIIGRVARLMKKPFVIDSPSGRVPEKASRWDRGRTEACGGGKVFSSVSLVYWEYLRIYSAGIRSGGATRGPQAWGGAPSRLVASSWLFWSSPEALWVSSGPEKINPNFFFLVWTLFDNEFLKRQTQ